MHAVGSLSIAPCPQLHAACSRSSKRLSIGVRTMDHVPMRALTIGAFAFTFVTLALGGCGSSTDRQGSGGAGGAPQLGGTAGESAGGNDSSAGSTGGDPQLPGSAGGDDSSAGGTGGDPQLPGGAGGTDSSAQCFPCEGYWICGGDVTQIDLVPDADGCLLRGLPGRNILSPDGTITANEVVVGRAQGSGARVHVSYPDGSQWLFCAGGGGPCP